MWDVRTYNCLQVFDEHVTQKPKARPSRADSAGARCAKPLFRVLGMHLHHTGATSTGHGEVRIFMRRACDISSLVLNELHVQLLAWVCCKHKHHWKHNVIQHGSVECALHAYSL